MISHRKNGKSLPWPVRQSKYRLNGKVIERLILASEASLCPGLQTAGASSTNFRLRTLEIIPVLSDIPNGKRGFVLDHPLA